MDFLVDKQQLKQIETVPSPPLVLSEGDVLIRIEKFAFTANNVSYAATGQALGYWNFFPIKNNNQKGRVPVWGVGVIVASRCNGISANRRVYGYFPMSHYVVLHPVQVTPADFIDGMPHRRQLPAVYNQYLLCDEDPFHSPRTEEAMMVLRPLFFTSWLLVDFFSQNSFFGANAMILSSASSKTSIGLAFAMKQYKQQHQQRKDNTITNIAMIGLTSARNQAMVQALNLYDQVIVYESLEQHLDQHSPSVFVDMAGNTQLTTRLHQHLTDNLKHSCLVGAAHVGQGGKPTSKLPGAKPKFFFAPAWTAKRIAELGAGDKRKGVKLLLHNVLLYYQLFVDWCLGENTKEKPWLHMKQFRGIEGVAKGYLECLQGKIAPNTAVIMSMWEEEESIQPTVSKL